MKIHKIVNTYALVQIPHDLPLHIHTHKNSMHCDNINVTNNTMPSKKIVYAVISKPSPS